MPNIRSQISFLPVTCSSNVARFLIESEAAFKAELLLKIVYLSPVLLALLFRSRLRIMREVWSFRSHAKMLIGLKNRSPRRYPNALKVLMVTQSHISRKQNSLWRQSSMCACGRHGRPRRTVSHMTFAFFIVPLVCRFSKSTSQHRWRGAIISYVTAEEFTLKFGAKGAVNLVLYRNQILLIAQCYQWGDRERAPVITRIAMWKPRKSERFSRNVAAAFPKSHGNY